MNKKERVIAAVNHIETDIIPYTIEMTQQEQQRLEEFLRDVNFTENIGNHIEGAYYSGFPNEDKSRPGYFLDDFGVWWNRNGADKDIGVVEGLVLPSASMVGYSFPTVDGERLRKMYGQLVNNQKDTFKFATIGFSMFERAWSLRGMENILMDMILEPQFVHQILDKICEYNLKIMDIALEFPFDGFFFGDDWGQQKELIMGPTLWREFIKPRMAAMYNKAKGAGKVVAQHSCGDIEKIFPDLIEIGLDIYQTFQPEIYDIESVKTRYGKDLTFWGGISTQTLLPYETPEKVRSEARRIMDVMGKGGGYIAAPTHAVPFDVPPENIIALADVFKNQPVRSCLDNMAVKEKFIWQRKKKIK